MARSDDLVVEEVADEVLIYDQRTNQAHCLSASAGEVWRACDGESSAAQLTASLNLDPATVALALDELGDCGLLLTGASAGVTRRAAAVKLARYGAAASAPLIYSIVAPTPALATSEATCFAICNTGCGACQQAGCCCTAPGGGSNKLCSANLAACQALVPPFAHCGETITSTACSAGC